MRAAFIVAASVLVPVAALADEGETGVLPIVALEGTTARHPKGVPDLGILSVSPALVAGAGVQYGLSNVLDARLGLEAAVAANVPSPRASVKGAAGDLITGFVLDARLPLALAAHLDAGLPVSAGLVLEAGPALTLWSSSALVDPARKDAAGRPVRLPITVDDEIGLGAFVRFKLTVHARPLDALSLSVEPYASGAWVSGPSLSVGVALRPTWQGTAGPL